MQPIPIGQSRHAPSALSHAYARVRGIAAQNEEEESKGKARSVVVGVLLFIGFVLLSILALKSGSSSSSNKPPSEDLSPYIETNDPEIFEKELKAIVDKQDEGEMKAIEASNPSSEGSDQEESNSMDELLRKEDDPIPKDCKSRRDDYPGKKRGARIHFIHIPKSGGTSVVSVFVLFLKHKNRANQAIKFLYKTFLGTCNARLGTWIGISFV